MKNCAVSNTDTKHSSQLELNLCITLVFKVPMSSLFFMILLAL